MKFTSEETRKIKVSLFVIIVSIIVYQIFNNFGVFTKQIVLVYQNALAPLVTAFFMAYIMNIPMSFIEKYLDKWTKLKQGARRGISILLALFFFLLVFFVLLRFAIPQLTESVNSLSKNIDIYIRTAREWLTTTFANYDIQMPQMVVDKVTEMMNELVNFLSKGIGIIAEALYSWLTGTLTSIMGLVVSFVISLYMLVEKEQIGATLKRVLLSVAFDKVSERVLWVLAILNLSFSNFFRGQLIEGVILAALSIITMSLFGFPYAVLIGSIVGFTNIIPMIGAFLGGAIGFVIIFMTNPVQALWFALYVVVLQQIESNLIYPRVVGNAIGLSGFWIFVAVTIGGGIGGLSGIIIGIPLFTTMQIILTEFTTKRLEEQRQKQSKPAKREQG